MITGPKFCLGYFVATLEPSKLEEKKRSKKSLATKTTHELGGGFKYFLFSSLLGEDSHFDDHIFQMG